MNTLDELRARCVIDPATRCWLWQGACCEQGQPRIYTIDYARKTKRVMSGPTATWNIAHQESPLPGPRPYRTCGTRLCLNPVHLRMAASHADVMAAIARQGRLKGTNLTQRRAAARRGQLAQGMRVTPDAVVRQILAAKGTNVAVAERFSVSHQVVSRIRLGQAHKRIKRPTPLLEAA
jgi:hypothetical protein